MGNKSEKKIPHSVISRLFVYLRELTELDKLNIRVVSSAELGERTNLSDTQVRKDLGYFGQFGVSGSGYNISKLKNALENILTKDKDLNVAVVGTGKLASALLAYPGFEKHGLKIVSAFDKSKSKIGKKIGDIFVQPVDELEKVVKKKHIVIGIITTPAQFAQEIADKLVNAGVKCILNFAPATLNIPKNVKIKDIDLSRELETLSYFLKYENK
ncbi:MAG: redox-sensing transcriptional repressor Rex [Candidatus Omnitrophota bacterium]